jgi:hypothetical protein
VSAKARTQTTSLPTDPWQFMAYVSKAAQETGIDVEQAFRFVSALLLMIAAGTEAAKSPERPQ